MAIPKLILCFILLCMLGTKCLRINAQLDDSVLQEEGAGSGVVLISIVRIRQSNIFTGDNDLLRRIAYVETRDGTDDNTYRDGYHGGIWAVDESAFLDTQDTVAHPHLSAIFLQIQQQFEINWLSATWIDLRKPFFSALAARLILSNAAASIPPLTDITAQANFWVQYYNPSGSTSQFTVSVRELEGAAGTLGNAANEFFLGFTANVFLTSGVFLHIFVTTPESEPVNFVVSTLTGFTYSGSATNTQTIDIDIPPSFIIRSTSETNKGIRIKADENKKIVVYGLNYYQYSSDAFLALPCDRFAVDQYDYYAISYHGNLNYPSTILLVGCEDDTTITTGSNTFVLDRQETYLLSSTSELTGTRIASNKPISVFTGDVCTNVPIYQPACDHITEQVPPTVIWGSFFLAASFLGKSSGEIFRIAAADAATVVTVNCNTMSSVSTHTLNNAGSWVEFQISGNSFCSIESNKPILVMEFALAYVLDNVGDPFIAMVPPVEQYSNNYVLSVLSEFSTNYITVYVAPEYYQSSKIFVDSLNLQSYSWTTVYCSDGTVCGYVTRVPLDPGEHRLYHQDTEAKIGVSAYGFNFFNSYGYPGGLQLIPIQLATVSFSDSTYYIAESAGQMEITVVRAGDTARVAIVLLTTDESVGSATAESDYTRVTQILEFESEETVKQITLEVFDDKNAEQNETFELYLTAGAGVHLSPYPRVAVVITNDDFVPGPPRDLQVTLTGTREAFITWQLPAIINPNNILLSFTITLAEDQFDLPAIVIDINSTTTSYAFTELEEYNTYSFNVTATNEVGTGAYSSISFTTQEAAPASAPKNLTAIPINSTSISLSWLPPPEIDQNGLIREYRINVTEVDTGTEFQLVSSTTLLAISSLHPDYTYQCTVSAYTVAIGPFSEVASAKTLEDVPNGYPQNFTGEATSSRSAVISWEPPSSEEQNGMIISYIINVTVVETGEMFQLFSTTNTLTLNTLSPYTTYICIIAARTSVGLGPFSTTFTVQTPEDVPTSPPQNYIGVASTSRSVFLSWDPPPPREQNGVIREYRITITEVETGISLELNSTTTSITISSLHPFYTYEWAVSCYTVGVGPYTEISTVTTPEDVPTSPPQQLTGTAPSSTVIYLSWDPPPSEDQNGVIREYRINITETNTGRVLYFISSTISITVSSLHPFYTYDCLVAAYTIGVGPYTAVFTLITPEDIPTSPPQNPNGIAQGSRMILLSWDPPPISNQNGIIREYKVNVTEVDTGRMWQIISTTTSINVSSLHPYYLYEWIVSSFTIGDGPYTSVSTVMTPEDVPTGYPINFIGSAISSRTVVITWDPPSLEQQNGVIIGYVINVTEVETGNMFQLFSMTTNLTVSSLSPYTTYVCIIAGTTSVGTGTFSTAITIQTPEDLPTSAPQNPNGISTTSTTISLTWTPPPPRDQNGVIREYRINITEVETGTTWQVVSTTIAAIVQSLHPFYRYEWSVSAYTIGVGPYTAISVVTTAEDVPTRSPQNPFGIASNSRTIHLSWNPPPAADQNGIIREYRINITEVETGRVLQIMSNTTSANISLLHPYYNYEWVVSAYTVGDGPYTGVSTVMTPEDAPTAPPTELHPTDTTPTSITFVWLPPPANEINGIIDYYVLEITETNGFQSMIYHSVETHITIGSLQAFQAYECKIGAFTVGLGPFSPPIMVATQEKAPTASPTNISVESVSGESVSLSWDPPPPTDRNGVIRLYILLVTHTQTNMTFSETSNSTMITVNDLIPLQSYSFSIAAETVEVGPFSQGIIVTLPEGAPSAPPANVRVTVLTASSISISWEPPQPEQHNGVLMGYLVSITEIETDITFQLSTNNTTLVVSMLHPSYNYACRVAAVTVESGPLSLAVTIKTLETEPSAPPQFFTATPVSSRSVYLLWDPPLLEEQNGVITGYIINVTVLETGEMFQLYSNTNNLTLDSLRPYTTYICVIAAQTAIGIGPYSITYEVTTPEDIPSRPNDLSVQTVQGSPNALFLTWNPPNEQNGIIISYNVYCDASSDVSEPPVISIVFGDGLEVTVSGLRPYTLYECYVTANTSAGEGETSAFLSARTDESTPDDPPDNFIGSVINSTALLLTWSEPLFPNGIIISYTVMYNLSGTSQVQNVFSNNIIVTGLDAYTVYKFTVSASTRIGPGPITEFEARTMESNPDSPPENLQSSVASSRAATIVWSSPPIENWNAPSIYFLLIVTDEQFNFSLTANTTYNNFTLTDLEEYNTYTCLVAAATQAGAGPFSDPIVFTTQQDRPSAPPQFLHGVAQSPSVVTFTWFPPPAIDINGILQYYAVSVLERETGRFFSYFAVDSDITLDDLHPFFNYECRVAAYTTTAGPFSEIVTVQTEEAGPSGPPTNLVQGNITSHSLALLWYPPALEATNGIIRNYVVACTEIETGNTFNVRTSSTELIITDLHPFYTYACAVAAETVAVGPYTSQITIQLREGAPNAPPTTLFGSSDSTTITLSWNPPPPENQNGIIRHYIINVTELDTGESFILTSANTDIVLSSLHPFYAYEIRIAAVTIATGPSAFLRVQTEKDVPNEAPQSIAIAEASADSISLTWNAPESESQNGIITGYVINVTAVETEEVFQIFSATNSVTLNSLRPFTTYFCTVAAQTAIGVGPFSIIIMVDTLEAAPSDSPEDFMSTDLSSTSITLSWSPLPLSSQNGIIREYRINITEVETGSQFEIATTLTSITLSSLHPYYAYECSVSAYTVAAGPYSEIITIRTAEDVPVGYPQNFGAIEITSRSAILTWLPPLPEEQNGIIISYVINVSAVETGETFQLYSVTNEVIVDTLSPFTMYICVVAASTSIGTGPFSTAFSLRTPQDVPTSSPQNPTAISLSSTSISLQWDPPPPGERNGVINNYRINITEFETGRNFQVISTTTLQIISMLHPYYTYEWSVSAYTIGAGPYTMKSVLMTLEDVPSGAPQNILGTTITPEQISLNWGTVNADDANGIIVSYQVIVTALNTGEVLTFYTTSRNITISSLLPFTTYLCAVAASTSIGSGPFSEEIAIQTLEAGPSSHPQNSTGTALNSTHILLTWDPPPPNEQGGQIRGYTINVTELETGLQFLFSSEVNEVTIGPLHPYYTYSCIIAAITVEEGPYTTNIIVRTHEAAPSGPPRSLQAFATSSRSINISWNPPLPEQFNGIIRQYIVTLVLVGTSEIHSLVSVGTSLEVPGLTPFSTYLCSVAAHTIATGQQTEPLFVITLEDIPVAPPQDLQGTPIDSRRLLLTWKPPLVEHRNGMIRRYRIRVIESENRTVEQFVSNSTTFEVTNLHPFYIYTSSVAAETIGLGPYTTGVITEMPEAAPTSPPTDVILGDVSSSSFQLSWKNLPSEDHNGIIRHYVIDVMEENTGIEFQITSVAMQTTLEFLHPYYNYTCTIAAVTTDIGPYSIPITVTTSEDAPSSPPENFQVQPKTPTSVIFSYDIPPQASQNGLIIGYFINITVLQTAESFIVFSETNTVCVDSLRPFTTYECAIAAQTSAGVGPYSSTLTVITPEDAPSAPPEGLVHTFVSSTSVTLQWNPPPVEQQNGLIRHYVIGVFEENTGQNYSLTTTSMVYFVGNLHPFYTYIFSVSAATTELGPYAQHSIMTAEDAPSSYPNDLVATPLNSQTLLLSWSPPSPEDTNGIITSYYINISVLESGDQFQLVSNTTSIVVEELHPHYTYFCIVATFTIAIGPFTEVYSVQMPEDVPTAPPRNARGEALNSTTIFITWQSPEPEQLNGIITFYTLSLLEVPTNATFTYRQEGHTELVITSLHPYYSYECSIAAGTIVGHGPFSIPFTIQTQQDVPTGAPHSIDINTVNSRSLYLTWEPPNPETQNGNIVHYLINVAVSESPDEFVLMSVATSTSIENLHPFYTYTITISAVTTGPGPSSLPFTVTTPEDAPTGVPQNVAAVAVSSRSIRFTWGAPLPEEQNGIIRAYNITINELETENILFYEMEGTATLLIVNSLHPFYSYRCSVAAITVALGPAAVIDVQTFSEAPSGVPQNTSIVAINATTAQLTWEPPPLEQRNGIIQEYIIKVIGIDTNEEFEIYSNQLAVSVYGLHPFYLYKFSIAAQTIAAGPFSAVHTLQMPEAAPAAPVRNVTVSSTSPTSAVVSWLPPEVHHWNGIITRYKIVYEIKGSVDGDPDSFQISIPQIYTTYIPLHGTPLANDVHPLTVKHPLQLETVYLTELQEFYIYQFMISTETAAGESEFNEPELLEMPEAAPTGAPVAINITVLSSTSLLITWQPPEPLQRNGIITGYEVRLISLNNDTSKSFEIRENTHSLQVHGLQKYSEFRIRISARTVVDFGPFSEIYTARTLEDIPEAPQDVTFEFINSTALTLYWKPPENPNGIINSYQVLYVGYSVPKTFINRQVDVGVEVIDGPHTQVVAGNLSTMISELIPGITYDFKVRARTNVGYGDNSTELTIELPELDKPSDLEDKKSGSNVVAPVLVVLAVIGWLMMTAVVVAVIWYRRRKKHSFTVSSGGVKAVENDYELIGGTFSNKHTDDTNTVDSINTLPDKSDTKCHSSEDITEAKSSEF